MPDLGRVTTWLGAAYGAVASAYLLAWYVSALLSHGRSAFDLLEKGTFLGVLLFVHFSVGLLSMLRVPKYWIPLAPPSENFKTFMKAVVLVSICNILLYVPSLVRFGASANVQLFVPSIFLFQTLYILAHYTSGYTLFGERPKLEERVRIVLEGIKIGDVSRVCETYKIPPEIYRRWESEIEQSSMGDAISKLKSGESVRQRKGDVT